MVAFFATWNHRGMSPGLSTSSSAPTAQLPADVKGWQVSKPNLTLSAASYRPWQNKLLSRQAWFVIRRWIVGYPHVQLCATWLTPKDASPTMLATSPIT